MDQPWLRFLTSRTITKLGPGPKYTLDASFNDSEIPHVAREEHAARWCNMAELTGRMFFSYPMGDFFVIETWVQSELWRRTQLGDGPGVKKS